MGEKRLVSLSQRPEKGASCVCLYTGTTLKWRTLAHKKREVKREREREIELEALPLLSGLYGDPSTGDERKHRNGGLQPTRSKFNSGRLAPQVFR